MGEGRVLSGVRVSFQLRRPRTKHLSLQDGSQQRSVSTSPDLKQVRLLLIKSFYVPHRFSLHRKKIQRIGLAHLEKNRNVFDPLVNIPELRCCPIDGLLTWTCPSSTVLGRFSSHLGEKDQKEVNFVFMNELRPEERHVVSS